LQPERRLFGLIAGGDQPCDQVDQEIDGAAMTGMLDLTDVFELISDGLSMLTPKWFMQVFGEVD